MKKIIVAAVFTVLSLSVLAQVQVPQHPMRLWYDSPAKYFEESLPIGNGKVGALIYGAPDNDTI